MNAIFPFGFPWPTAFYLVLYLLTLVIHWIFMNYVLAGTAFTLCAVIFSGKGNPPNPIDSVLREWLPLVLSGAITAGIAPLLFLQILYQYQFYSANLVLFHRWMAILPTLIAAFYLLYLLRSRKFGDWSRAVRLGIALAAFACFGFIAWSWTENHLLSLNEGVWPEQYASSRLFYQTQELAPRLSLWFVLAFPTMATIVGWQLWYRQDDRANAETPGCRQASILALVGVFLFVVVAGIYTSLLPVDARDVVLGDMSRPYVILAGVGIGIQLAAWGAQYLKARFTMPWLVVASAGVLLTQAGVAVARESIRLASLDISSLYARHVAAAEVGGIFVFLFFLVVNAALVAASILLVRRGLRPIG